MIFSKMNKIDIASYNKGNYNYNKINGKNGKKILNILILN